MGSGILQPPPFTFAAAFRVAIETVVADCGCISNTRGGVVVNLDIDVCVIGVLMLLLVGSSSEIFDLIATEAASADGRRLPALSDCELG